MDAIFPIIFVFIILMLLIIKKRKQKKINIKINGREMYNALVRQLQPPKMHVKIPKRQFRPNKKNGIQRRKAIKHNELADMICINNENILTRLEKIKGDN